MADMRFSAEEPDRPAAKLVLGDSGSGTHAGLIEDWQRRSGRVTKETCRPSAS